MNATRSKLKLGSYFETRTRSNGERFVTLRDDRPSWLQDAVRDAHAGTLPNDWIYRECEAACDMIDDGAIDGRYPEDAIHEHADSRVDIYTQDLYRWASEMCLTDLFSSAEDEAEEVMANRMTSRLQMVQYYAIRTITQTIVDAWRENQVDEDEEDDS